MGPVTVTTEVLNSLGAKLEELDLSEAERAVLDHILARAASADEAEVSGFGEMYEEVAFVFDTVVASPTADRLGKALLGIGNPMYGDFPFEK